MNAYNPEYWVCYSCGGACECEKCKRRRAAGRRNQDAIKAREELLSVQPFRRPQKINEKRRMKFYDTISEDEEEARELEEEKETFNVSRLEDEPQIETPKKILKTEQEINVVEKESTNSVRGSKKKKQKRESRRKEKQQLEEAEEEKIEEEKSSEKEESVKVDKKLESIIDQEVESKSQQTEDSGKKHLLKKKRVRKSAVMDKEDIDDSKIISEVSIDYGNF